MTLKPFCIMTVLFFVVLPNDAGAWFDGGRGGRPFSTRTAANSLTATGSLAVYDDISAGSEGVVAPLNPFFLPVDTVDLDIPLTFLVKTPVSSMEALDRLIVANLRLKLLIEEYNALQKRADELLKSVVIPYLDSPWLAPGKGGGKNLNENKKTLDKRLDEILVEGHGLDRLQSTPVNLPSLGFSTGWVPGSKTALNRPSLPAADPVENYNPVTATPGVAPLSSVSSVRELPWIFDVFLKFFSYCLAHRLEVLLYGSILLLAGSLISLQVRHGK